MFAPSEIQRIPPFASYILGSKITYNVYNMIHFIKVCYIFQLQKSTNKCIIHIVAMETKINIVSWQRKLVYDGNTLNSNLAS